MKAILFIAILSLACFNYVIAQNWLFSEFKSNYQALSKDKKTLNSPLYYFDDSSFVKNMYPQLVFLKTERSINRGINFIYYDPSAIGRFNAEGARTDTTPPVTTSVKTPFIKIHGNVTYDVYYQSNIDTPYIQQDLYQHTLTTYLDITVKDNYPLRVSFTSRFSNSSLFKNFNGLNLQFNSQEFKNKIKEKVAQWAVEQMKQKSKLEDLKSKIESKAKLLAQLQSWLVNPSQLQKLVEAKEREIVNNKMLVNKNFSKGLFQNGNDSTSKDTGKNIDSLRDKFENTVSAIDSFEVSYAKKKSDYDSLSKQLSKLENQYHEESIRYGSTKDQILNDLKGARNIRQLTEKLKSNNIPDSLLPKGYKTLLAVRSFGIGRTIVDYSELSAKSISITGVQFEYNPSYYVAFASGFVDYRFRDYIINDPNRQKQYLSLIRVGKGMKDGNSIILTYYTGKKQLYNYNTSNTTGGTMEAPNFNLMGVTLEGRYKINASSYLIAEAAKSSLPYYNRQQNKQSILSSTLNLEDHSNEAYSVKLVSFIPGTKTKINASYKHIGANFQSFSLFTTGSAQTAWAVKADQPLFKRKLTISAGVRTNDYTNPYLTNVYSSNTVFKSIQGTLRIRKWPVVSVGYFPSSQLTKLNDERFMENLFYTFVGNISHFYRYHSTMMNSFISYTQFYNKTTDSNFVYFNTRNLLLSQNVFLKKFTLQFDISQAKNTSYQLYTAGGNIQHKIKEWWTLGGGLKYNKQTVFNREQVGYSLNSKLKISKLGEIQVFVEKGFLPGIEKQLIGNKVGRITYSKVF